MILLVVGLVAVIVVVLIAVFLSIRLGRGDEHNEADLEPSGRDRRRDQDERWRDPDTRRVPVSSGRAGRSGEYAGYDSRGPARDQAPRGRDYDSAPQRPAREGSDYGVSPSPRRSTRKPAAARSAVDASVQARGRHDTGPSRRPAAFPSADHPSMDFGPAGGYATGDHPSDQFPAVGYEAVDDSRDRSDSRRKAAVPANSKSRSRQRSKRDDDDDWPSSEWDKLSDEQYWAELSADKPLSTMARPSRPASNGAAEAPANGSAKAKPPVRESRPSRPSRPAEARRDTQRDLPSRRERADQSEPATERLPVRTARQATPPLPPPGRGADAPASRSYPGSRSVLDSGPRASRDTGPLTGPHVVTDTGPLPLEPRRRDTTGPQPATDRDLATLNRLASVPPPIPGALEDDPLTSPSFSLKAVPASDSRSYSNARKHAKTAPSPDHSANGNGHGSNGHSSGGYPAGDYSDPGYAYQPAPPAADWYSAPPAQPSPRADDQTSAYGNPYARTGPGHGGPAAAHADSQATASYDNYLADPLRVYSGSGYEAPAPYDAPAYLAAPPPPAPYANGYPAQPYTDQPGDQDGYGTGGYASGDQAGYPGDPYTPGGYGPYPPQG